MRPSEPARDEVETEGRAEPARERVETKARPRLLPLLLIFMIQAIYLCICLAFAASYPVPPRLVAEDVLALPGREVELAVRVVDDVPGPFLSRYQRRSVSLVLDPELSEGGKSPSERLDAVLGAEGRATIPWEAPEEAGMYAFRVTLPADDDVSARLETLLTVWVVPADRPLVLASIHPPALSAQGVGEPYPRKSARSLLDSLEDGRIIVYLQVGNPSRIDDARHRFRIRGFPPGPVVGVDVPAGSGEGGESLSLTQYLKQHITGSWKRVEWAITTDVPHQRAFARAGLRTLLVHPAASSLRIDHPTVFRAADWKEAHEIVETRARKEP